jgi:glycine oxidase
MNPSRFDVVIVGGGVIGMACAEALSRDRKRKICIVEKNELGRAASWAGGGLLSPLPPDQCDDAIRPLLDESLALYPEWCERLQRESGIDPEYWVCGADYFKNSGEHIEYPQMAQVRNPRLMKALAQTLRRRGVSVFEHAAAAVWLREGERVRGVRTTRGDIATDVAILAAGAWSAEFGADGIMPVKGQMLLLDARPGALPRVRIGDDVYLIPRRDGQVLVGSTLEDAGFDLTPTESARRSLIERAARLWPEAATLPLIRHWAGLRPRADRDAPLLEASATHRGLYLASGHFRLGITLAPASAARMMALLRDP